MSTNSNDTLSRVKEQVEKMFKTIEKLESNAKTEAFGYVRKCLDTNNLSTTESNDENQPTIAKAKTIRNKKRKRYKRTKYPTKLKCKRTLKCRLCGSISKTKRLLLKHLETHIGTPITCKSCKISFNNRAAFLCHSALKMCSVGKYNCDQCQNVFRFKRHFERHIEGHRRNNCTYCDARLTRRKQLVHHLLTKHSIKLERTVMHKCQYCEKRYVKKRSLYHHLKQHADNKIVCMECGWMSETAEEHSTHFTQHDKDRPWKCEKCNDRFSRRQQYLFHMKRHDRYKCITCNETFASKIRVLRHKQRGHSVQGLEPQLKCPHCPMAFQRRMALQIHVKKHLDDKLMHCKYCDKKFRSPYLYFRHCTTTVHEINSPQKQQLVCEICGKFFVKKYQLEQHLHRVHDHMKQQHICEYCGHKSTSKKNMDRHLALHLEDKRDVICDQCGKSFYNITTLKDHISYVHSNERHFKCNKCDKAFKRNSELIRHETAHSNIRPHVCKLCGVSYKRTTHLRRHEETQHGTQSPNRRVQRLTKNENGQLVPIPDQKKKPKRSNKPATSKLHTLSFMDAQSGEMITLTLPPETPVLNASDLIELPNLVFNSNGSDQIVNELNALEPTLAQTVQNSTTCDILIPENRVLNLQLQQNASNDSVRSAEWSAQIALLERWDERNFNNTLPN